MEEFTDLYRYLARCYAELDTLKRDKIDEFLQRISELITTDKTGPVLIKLLSDLVKRSDDVEKLDESLNTILPAITGIEDTFNHSSGLDTQNQQSPTRLFDRKTVLAIYGSCKIYPKILDYLWKNLKTRFDTPDVTFLITKFYKKQLRKTLALSSAKTYATVYVKYMIQKKMITDNNFVYTKHSDKSGDVPEEKTDTKLLEKEELKNTDVKLINNEFENFQDRILEAARSNEWEQVAIEEIEESFKGTKNEKQVQKALGQLLVKEKVMQLPPTHEDIVDSRKNNKPKPKGYIRFISFKPI